MAAHTALYRLFCSTPNDAVDLDNLLTLQLSVTEKGESTVSGGRRSATKTADTCQFPEQQTERE